MNVIEYDKSQAALIVDCDEGERRLYFFGKATAEESVLMLSVGAGNAGITLFAGSADAYDHLKAVFNQHAAVYQLSPGFEEAMRRCLPAGGPDGPEWLRVTFEGHPLDWCVTYAEAGDFEPLGYPEPGWYVVDPNPDSPDIRGPFPRWTAAAAEEFNRWMASLA